MTYKSNFTNMAFFTVNDDVQLLFDNTLRWARWRIFTHQCV